MTESREEEIQLLFARIWQTFFYGMEWVVLLSSIVWGIEAGAASQGAAPQAGAKDLSRYAFIEETSPSWERVPAQELNHAAQVTHESEPEDREIFKDIGLNRDYLRASEQTVSGSNLSSSFKSEPFYVPSSMVLFRFDTPLSSVRDKTLLKNKE